MLEAFFRPGVAAVFAVITDPLSVYVESIKHLQARLRVAVLRFRYYVLVAMNAPSGGHFTRLRICGT
jgi:hypothetical protein